MKRSLDQQEELFAPGHRACPGCGEAILCRMVLKTTGRNVIVVSPTGCIETFTSPYLYSPWRVPWIHPLFENAPSIASGIAGVLKAKGMDKEIKVVVIAGDGATFDIGLGALSGMFERGDNVTYICADNEAYDILASLDHHRASRQGVPRQVAPQEKFARDCRCPRYCLCGDGIYCLPP